jgi:hypothetical protein
MHTLNRATLICNTFAVCAALLYALTMQSAGAGMPADAHQLLDPTGGLLLVWLVGHCDTMDGPLVTLARKALETSNVDLVLPWVQEGDEPAMRAAFTHTLQVREISPAARELADRYFFETLVRVHRAGEGAPYTGLKPAGLDLGPAIPAADRSLEDGSVEPVIALVAEAVRRGIRTRHAQAMEKKRFDPHDVRAGRAYVEAYVAYVHYVERLYLAATSPVHGHYPEDTEHGAERAHVH